MIKTLYLDWGLDNIFAINRRSIQATASWKADIKASSNMIYTVNFQANFNSLHLKIVQGLL